MSMLYKYGKPVRAIFGAFLFLLSKKESYTIYIKICNCIVRTEFHHTTEKVHSLQNLILRFFLEIFAGASVSLNDMLMKQILIKKKECNPLTDLSKMSQRQKTFTDRQTISVNRFRFLSPNFFRFLGDFHLLTI